MSGILSQYLAYGDLADRPATPSVQTNGLAFYFAEDTVELWVWAGSWIAVLTGGDGGDISPAIQYTSDTGSTADSDPGAGLLKWNNATQGSATQLYLDDASADGVSLVGLWPALNKGGFMFLQDAVDRDIWQLWSNTAVTDASGYAKINVTLLTKSTADFTDDAAMLVTIQQGPTPARSTVTAVSSVAGVVTLNWALGDYFTITLTEDVSSWVISNPPGSGNGFTLMVESTQDSTPRTVAKPGTTPGGAALDVSTGSGAKDVIAISSFNNGTTLRSNIAKAYS